MARSLPTGFGSANWAFNGAILVKITDVDNNVTRVATTDVHHENYWQGIVTDVAPITRSVDLVSMRTESNNCQVTISALPYTKTSGSAQYWSKILDAMDSALAGKADIYLYAGGPEALTEADLFLLGSFKIAAIHMIDATSLALDLEQADNELVRDVVKLPQNRATRALFPEIDEKFVGITLPLAYGDFSESQYSVLGSNGWMPMLRTAGSTWLAADHELYDENGAGDPNDWLELVLFIEPVKGIARHIASGSSYVSFANTGGRCVCSVSDIEAATFEVNIKPTRIWGASTSTTAILSDGTMSITVKANSTSEAIVYFEWGQSGSPEDSATVNAIGEIVANTAGLYATRSSAAGAPDNYYWEVWDGGAWVTFATNPAGTTNTFDGGTGYDYLGSKGTFWHLAAGPKGGTGNPFKCRIRMTKTAASWTANTTTVAVYTNAILTLDAKQMLARVSDAERGLKAPRQGGVRDTRGEFGGSRFVQDDAFWKPRDKSLDFVNVGWRGYGGRCFGAWASGRTSTGVGAIAEGDVIQGPQYIVESLLRDELGFVDAEIDEPSFDASAVYDTSFCLRLPAGTEVPAQELIERLCYEFGFVLFLTGDGKWRIKDYLTSLPAANATIRPDDLYDMTPILSTTPMGQIVNDLSVEYGQTPAEDFYYYHYNKTDSTSQTLYGVRNATESMQWQQQDTSGYITDATDSISARLVSATGVLSRVHGTPRMRTIGWKFINLELMDVVAVDSSMDAHMKYFGNSWSTATFYVVGIAVTQEGVTLDLWDTAALR